jgi:hypothetical protein
VITIGTFDPGEFPFSAERIYAVNATGWHISLVFTVLAKPHFRINVFPAFEKGTK